MSWYNERVKEIMREWQEEDERLGKYEAAERLAEALAKEEDRYEKLDRQVNEAVGLLNKRS